MHLVILAVLSLASQALAGQCASAACDRLDNAMIDALQPDLSRHPYHPMYHNGRRERLSQRRSRFARMPKTPPATVNTVPDLTGVGGRDSKWHYYKDNLQDFEDVALTPDKDQHSNRGLVPQEQPLDVRLKNRKRALVVGINYRPGCEAVLHACDSDAEQMRKLLFRRGFQVQIIDDAKDDGLAPLPTALKIV